MITSLVDEIILEFDGYRNVDGFVPNTAGIYCIYRAEPYGRKSVSLLELLYIGEADNINRRFSNHEHRKDWDNRLIYSDEFLVYSFAPIAYEYDRKQAEAAMIYAHKRKYPALINTSGTDSFNHDDVTITTEGKNYLLYKRFNVSTDNDGRTRVKIYG